MEQPYTAKERLYLDSKGNVAREGDPNYRDRVSLLAAPGRTIPAATARELGLLSESEDESGESGQTGGDADSDGTAAPATPTAPKGRSKSKKAADENKAVKPGEDKSGGADGESGQTGGEG